jgi:hypothetical protein
LIIWRLGALVIARQARPWGGLMVEKIDVTKHYRLLFEMVGLEWPKNKRAKVDANKWRLLRSRLIVDDIEEKLKAGSLDD